MNNKRNFKKEKMLLQLKKELAYLEFLANHYQLVKLQNKMVQKIRIVFKGLEYIVPYFLIVTILTGTFKLVTSSFPFYLDNTKKYLKTIKEFNSTGFIKIERTYEEKDINSNILVYTTPWMKEGNDSFVQETRTYNLNILSEENIQTLLENPDINFEDILGEPTNVSKEYSSFLDEEAINFKPSLKAYLYQEDSNDYIVVKEEENYNILITILYCIMALGANLATYFSLLSKADYHFILDVKEIIKNNNLTQKDLVRILEIKKKNYDRLTGDNDESI